MHDNAAPERIWVWTAAISWADHANPLAEFRQEFRQWHTTKPTDKPECATEYTRTDRHTAALAARDARIGALEAGLRHIADYAAEDDLKPTINGLRCDLIFIRGRARALLDGGKA